jgi:hypothetical protein
MATLVNNWTKTALTTISDSYLFLVSLTSGETKPISWASLKSLLGTYFDTLFLKLTGNQTVAGTKTFTSTITGSITGNAGTVTSGVYTTGNQTVAGVKTFSSTIVGNISGNAGTVTKGIYTDGSIPFEAKQTFSTLGINIPDYIGTLPTSSSDSMGVVGDILYFERDVYRKAPSFGWLKNGATF